MHMDSNQIDSDHIDSHQHFWRYNPQRDGWITDEMSVLKRDFLPEDLIPELRANHVQGCVAVQADQSEQETMFLLDLANRFPEIKGVVGWVDLCSANLPRRLEHFSQFEKLRGFRHVVQSEPDDRYMLREDFAAGIASLHTFGFTYDILIYPKQLPAAIDLVAKFPGQPFVVDHLAKPRIRSREIDSWARHMRSLAGSRNVYCKLSGLVTEADWKNWREADFRPYLDVAFDAFGPDRLMFGSDWPVCLLAGTYASVKALVANYIRDLPPAQQDKIMGLNAVSFYGLKVSRHEPATSR
jgi:L-fucono-1,5-lactonase